jgi:hypothetical protein
MAMVPIFPKYVIKLAQKNDRDEQTTIVQLEDRFVKPTEKELRG